MIEIMNMRYEKPKYNYDFRIDRVTPVGNPFFMKSEKERDIVCDRYELWFKSKVKLVIDSSNFRKYLDDMIITYCKYKKIRLFCWCSPKRCHGETIKNYLMQNEPDDKKEK